MHVPELETSFPRCSWPCTTCRTNSTHRTVSRCLLQWNCIISRNKANQTVQFP